MNSTHSHREISLADFTLNHIDATMPTKSTTACNARTLLIANGSQPNACDATGGMATL